MNKVVCSKCDGSSVVNIIDSVQGKIIEWKKIGTVISGRERFDANLGWQCYCGNNSLMTDQEKKQIEDWKQPTPKEIGDIISNLIPEIDTRFRMEAI